jgi:nucleoside-diphosphate kinase
MFWCNFAENLNRMSGNITFTMIKPSAVSRGYTGPIVAKFAEGGFRIVAMKKHLLTRLQAELFYEIHRERPFYADLVEFMISGPVVAAILEKENAVEDFRNFIGATDPAKAAAGTIRQLYGISLSENAVHGSDSDENAVRESGFFFSELERS